MQNKFEISSILVKFYGKFMVTNFFCYRKNNFFDKLYYFSRNYLISFIIQYLINNSASIIISFYFASLYSKGFLPTFGPSFIHLYADAADVTGPIYRGRLLLSLRTEFDLSEATTSTGVQVESAPAIVEVSFDRSGSDIGNR